MVRAYMPVCLPACQQASKADNGLASSALIPSPTPLARTTSATNAWSCFFRLIQSQPSLCRHHIPISRQTTRANMICD